jgi:TPR repeat protein
MLASHEAIRWYSKAAEGDAQGPYNLAVMYYQAQGIPQGYKKAVERNVSG